ncbi:MAG: hypothetical protein KBS64_05885 [Treponema sp.]|nr:hypothetical protein [Candidatus Treponema equi]
MEVEYNRNPQTKEENFILPQTEKAINLIIGEFTFFFSLCRFVLQIVYIVYLILRAFYLKRFFWLTIGLLAFCLIQFIFLLINLKREKKISSKVQAPIRYAKRLCSLGVAAIVGYDIFILEESTQRWQAISAVLICLGWILAFMGDIFSATVPRYARMILNSFKKDIEPTALASRSLEKVKEAAGHMAKRKAVRSWRNIKSWFSDLCQ